MTNLRRWWCLTVCLGVLANFTFAAIAVFGRGGCLLAVLGLGAVASEVWLYNYSVLLALLSLFYLPAAFDPFTYRANAWLLIAARLIPAATFFMGALGGFMEQGFVGLGLADSAFGIAELALLLCVVSAEREARAPVAELRRVEVLA